MPTPPPGLKNLPCARCYSDAILVQIDSGKEPVEAQSFECSVCGYLTVLPHEA